MSLADWLPLMGVWRRLLAFLFLFFLWPGGVDSASAQTSEDPTDRIVRLTDNVDLLTIRIAVDRTDLKYLVGEVGKVTYTLTNTTAQLLEIPDPTDPLAGEIYMNDHSAECLAANLSDEQTQKCRWHWSNSILKPAVTVRSRTVKPGETITLVVRTTDLAPGSEVTEIGGAGFFNLRENSWELTHQLGGSLIIQTVAPVFEKLAWATLHATQDGLPMQVPVFAVRDGAEHVVCVSEYYSLTTDEIVEVDSNGKITPQGARTIAPFHRIATVPQAVRNLSATVDSRDWITVHADLGQGLGYSFVLDGSRNLVQTIIENPPETISTPAAPSGPSSGVSGTLYKFTASGAASSMGHSVQYSFNWGDGTSSGWTPPSVTSSFHTWTAPGTYTVTVQARCRTDLTVVSATSAIFVVTIAGESISTPAPPTGPATGTVGTASTFSASGASSSLGHSVQYRFVFGDGSVSPWLPVGTTTASHSWVAAATYQVTVEARCATDTQVISSRSAPLTVVVGSPAP
jgi:hypothetical protein